MWYYKKKRGVNKMFDLTSFKSFMVSFSKVESPMGDFAGDIAVDKDFPENEQTKERLTQYFEWQARKNRNPEVTKLFKTAWEFYSSLK